MKFDRKAAPGSRRRMAAMRSAKRSPSPQRRMRRSSGADTCWRERSKYGHAGGADGVDQRLGEVGRVQVEQPDPLDPLGHRLDQRDDRPLPHALVAPEGGEVLGDEHDLARPRGRRPRRGCRRRSASAACRGTTGWRRTRRPGRSPRPPSRRPTATVDAGRGRFSRSSRGRHRLGRRRRRGLAVSVTGHAEAGDRVDLGQGVGQLVAVALGHAAGDHEPGARRPGAVEARGSCRSTPAGPPRRRRRC